MRTSLYATSGLGRGFYLVTTVAFPPCNCLMFGSESQEPLEGGLVHPLQLRRAFESNLRQIFLFLPVAFGWKEHKSDWRHTLLLDIAHK
jgi:hypothetical protein